LIFTVDPWKPLDAAAGALKRQRLVPMT